MTSLALAPDLPSEDEEDEDFDPTKEADGSGDEKAKKAAGVKRSRGTFGRPVDSAGKHRGTEADEGSDEEDELVDPKTAAKRAKASALWDQLNSKPAPKQPAAASSAPAAGSAAAPLQKARPAGAFSLSSLCRPVREEKRVPDNRSWMTQLGLLPKNAAADPARDHGPSSTSKAAAATPAAPTSTAGEGAAAGDADDQAAAAPTPVATASSPPAARAPAGSDGSRGGLPQADRSKAMAAAAAALAAAKTATSVTAAQQHGKVAVSETRRFAGKDIQVTKQVAVAESEADKKARKKAGLDAVLASLQQAKKVNVLDKSRHDWTDYKKDHKQVEDELEMYKKSGDKYLDKVDFLKRAELREYEKERDKRLQGDVRNRGRL